MEKLEREPIITKTPLPEYLKMYDISGQDRITEHGFNRYTKNKEQDNFIKEQKENSTTLFIKRIKDAPEEEKSSLIKLGLENQNIEVQKVSVRMIHSALNSEATSLIKLGLENQNIEVQKEAAENIWLASEKEDLIPLRNILLAKIKQGLENPNIEKQKISVDMIRWAPEEAMAPLIKLCLNNSNIEVQRASTSVINSAPEEERAPLRNLVLAKIKQALEGPNIKEWKVSTGMIWAAPKEERAPLRNLVLAKIKQGLENSNIEIQKASVEMIWAAPKEEIVSLIKQGLENPNIEVQKASIEMIWAAEEKTELLNLIIGKGLGEELIKPPLYKNNNINKETFSRQKFNKTGSETTLIGGELKDKAIIRHIEPNAFLSWQKLYEDYTTWKNAGFDYVPIEPIQSYKLNKNGLVDVFSGVLDLSLRDWSDKTITFANQLEEQKKKIINVLDQLEIRHGHMHDGNFCLRFFRDENGRVDFKRVPRLYLIDFDQAVSP
jgi:hypothetical protein